MLFNSFIFLLAFLPVTLGGYYLLRQGGLTRYSQIWLLTASLLFYSYWYPPYLLLLLASIAGNYTVSRSFSRGSRERDSRDRTFLVAGIAFNLCLLGYFKYADFFIENVNHLLGSQFGLLQVALPLAISFYTFQQIAFLVDSYRGKVDCRSPLDYMLFVAFFPQLIAGPIVHFNEVSARLFATSPLKNIPGNLAIGLTVFLIGLFKKVVVADTMGIPVSNVFAGLASGASLSTAEAWIGSTAFYLQIYFDFSAYSDMAIGLAYMFGVRLPLNFNSPIKAMNSPDFWNRWHMTLTRFVRLYITLPLTGYLGKRFGKSPRWRLHVQLSISMLFGMFIIGLWHGASWTFVAWGLFNGINIVLFHLWKLLKGHFAVPQLLPRQIGIPLTWGFNFVLCVIGIALFRAGSLSNAFTLISTLTLQQGAFVATSLDIGLIHKIPEFALGLVVAVLGTLAMTLVLPNTQQIMQRYEVALGFHPDTPGHPLLARLHEFLRWQANGRWLAVMGVIAALSIVTLASQHGERFIYFDF